MNLRDIKVGDIVVKITHHHSGEKGAIYKIRNVTYNNLHIGGGWYVPVSSLRKATEEEIYAYDSGIRNIKKIKKLNINNFSII